MALYRGCGRQAAVCLQRAPVRKALRAHAHAPLTPAPLLHMCPIHAGAGQQPAPRSAVETLRQDAGRHRARWAPPVTPAGFWDLGFADSLDSRLVASPTQQQPTQEGRRRSQPPEPLLSL